MTNKKIESIMIRKGLKFNYRNTDYITLSVEKVNKGSRKGLIKTISIGIYNGIREKIDYHENIFLWSGIKESMHRKILEGEKNYNNYKTLLNQAGMWADNSVVGAQR